jgi:putative endonuclease
MSHGSTTTRRTLSQHGEHLAARHLSDRGFAVIARNVRTRHGEIDLIALDRRGPTSRHALVFAEVKTRRLGRGRAEPREDQLPLVGLRPRQQVHLRRLARAWLAAEGRPRSDAASIRFDAVGVLLDARGRLVNLEHLEDAF